MKSTPFLQDCTATIYSIVGHDRENMRLLMHIADAEEPGDFEKFRSAIFVRRQNRFVIEFYVSGWLTSLCEGPQGIFYAVSMDGTLFDNSSGNWTGKQLDRRFSFNNIRNIGRNRLYAVGMKGLFLEVQAGQFYHIATHTHSDIVDFAGNEKDFIHLIGEEGFIWRFDGRAVSPVDSPTNRPLASIAVNSENTFFICGQDGLLIRGGGSRWEALEETSADLFSVAVFEDKAFFAASEEGVLVLEGDCLRTFKKDWFADGVSVAGGSLVTFSECDIEAFDGKKWEKLEIDFEAKV